MKDVMLKIKGKQKSLEGEESVIELITEGKFYNKNGAYYLVYDESEISGMEGSTTTLKIQGQKVSMKRFGNNTSKLIFEKGKKHVSEYETMYGDMTMEVMTNDLDINISEAGKGSIDLSYRLNILDSLESNNHLTIDIM
ncbi:Uncharacterized beta-barrel protein YwiB, DUF1934 family [Proteiniborus ethanoligenes]|uniref:Uncharacterized beta-barrel protein YwiB, DUF1934 family n=1 Tax=Proteiniborus ethanoligenes TaxID=415015 RepID=A0A1H3M0T0_9FIRM|nr:DUF1934 domain-containing protein [Proteiniborus ethanoligenes]SDY70310.1 Uncharacterized beta-barrel protein YwiB, DUF1934 family [Proteiniborus ethanoligenes]